MRVEEIRKVGIVGAGPMGHGIAQGFALAGTMFTCMTWMTGDSGPP